MRVHLCGVRGSTPAPGAQFTRVGGHTSCVAIAHDGERHPRLVIDAGTGLRNVSGLMGGAPFGGSILLSHLHWDHTQGLPFFAAGDRPEAHVAVHLPVADGVPNDALNGLMAPPFFPISVDGLLGEWSFHALEQGRFDVEGFAVLARHIPHSGGGTFGFRVSDGRRSLAYLSDHGPIALGCGPDGWGPYHEAAMELAEGVDLLLHDAQFTAAELASRPQFGHSAVGYAVRLAERAKVGRVLLFHHDPSRTDDEVDALVAELASNVVDVDAAREGDTICW
ncbi:MAG TPA: MBL fold metallo-hydrolase [Ilumatobacteraceae bacterium]|nr:MBL fold metallo-hydrolase [Ilumatobacteraceae bacterium]